jgi:1,4-alpha-glucan branching enzyme
LSKVGYVSIVLHAHLPYVRHPKTPECLEELWLMEAITETYIPIIEVMDGLLRDNVPFRLTMSITPTLASMLADGFLQERYHRHITKLCELAEKEVQRTRFMPGLQTMAVQYLRQFQRARQTFEDCHYRLLDRFIALEKTGSLEIIASAATHGYLPLLYINPKAVEAQIALGVETYRHFFAKEPSGFWLPECAFTPGIDEILGAYGIRYVITDSHGIIHAQPRPRYSVYAPIYTPAMVAAFGRDWESSKQVWSASEGYPGDFFYRDFYRDIGFDLDYDYIKPYLIAGIRGFTGIKYYRISGKGNHKEIYDPGIAQIRAAEHAGNFMFNRELQAQFLAARMDRPPLIIAPYDAELFGHWWYEGPQWLDYLFRKAAYDQEVFAMITPTEYLQQYPSNQISMPSESSWGNGGYHEVWLDGSNDWIYRHLHRAADRMVQLANRYRHADGHLERALNQAARELLLAQASDWAFIMKTGTMVEYAQRRTREHISNFIELYHQITENRIDIRWLKEQEEEHNIFPWLDFRIYAGEIKRANVAQAVGEC